MNSDQILTAIIIASPSILVTLLLGIYTVRKNRQSAAEQNANTAEANDTDRFQTFMDAYERQRQNDATRIANLETKVAELTAALDILTSRSNAQGRDLKAIKTTVQNWFARLWQEWNHEAGPMPLPTAEELALLEITLPTEPAKPL